MIRQFIVALFSALVAFSVIHLLKSTPKAVPPPVSTTTAEPMGVLAQSFLALDQPQTPTIDLDRIVESFDVRNMPCTDALNLLSEQCKENIVFDDQFAWGKPVSVALHNVSLKSALEALSRQYHGGNRPPSDGTLRIRDGVIFVAPDGFPSDRTETRIYDIRDLIVAHNSEHFALERIWITCCNPTRDVSIEPESARLLAPENYGPVIEAGEYVDWNYFGGRCVVTATAHSHEAAAVRLSELRTELKACRAARNVRE